MHIFPAMYIWITHFFNIVGSNGESKIFWSSNSGATKYCRGTFRKWWPLLDPFAISAISWLLGGASGHQSTLKQILDNYFPLDSVICMQLIFGWKYTFGCIYWNVPVWTRTETYVAYYYCPILVCLHGLKQVSEESRVTNDESYIENIESLYMYSWTTNASFFAIS